MISDKRLIFLGRFNYLGSNFSMAVIIINGDAVLDGSAGSIDFSFFAEICELFLNTVRIGTI